jgi:hypothetical protein
MFTKTGTFNAVEIQISRVLVIGAALPWAPAGMVIVSVVPVAANPSIVLLPKSVFETCGAFAPAGGAGGLLPLGGAGGNVIFIAEESCEFSRATKPATGSKMVTKVRVSPEGRVIVLSVRVRPSASRYTFSCREFCILLPSCRVSCEVVVRVAEYGAPVTTACGPSPPGPGPPCPPPGGGPCASAKPAASTTPPVKFINNFRLIIKILSRLVSLSTSIER